jgi:hypothetical protein
VELARVEALDGGVEGHHREGTHTYAKRGLCLQEESLGLVASRRIRREGHECELPEEEHSQGTSSDGLIRMRDKLDTDDATLEVILVDALQLHLFAPADHKQAKHALEVAQPDGRFAVKDAH